MMATKSSWMCAGHGRRDGEWLWIDRRFTSCYCPSGDYDQVCNPWRADERKTKRESVSVGVVAALANRWCRTLTDHWRRDPSAEISASVPQQAAEPDWKRFDAVHYENWSKSSTTTSTSASASTNSIWPRSATAESSLDRFSLSSSFTSTTTAPTGDVTSGPSVCLARGRTSRVSPRIGATSDEHRSYVSGSSWNLLSGQHYAGSSLSLTSQPGANSTGRWKQFKHAGRNWRRRLYGRYLYHSERQPFRPIPTAAHTARATRVFPRT